VPEVRVEEYHARPLEDVTTLPAPSRGLSGEEGAARATGRRVRAAKDDEVNIVVAKVYYKMLRANAMYWLAKRETRGDQKTKDLVVAM